ncbi:MAG: PEP-CTERM sorting domain-containing protein [Luteolibacter sp.]
MHPPLLLRCLGFVLFTALPSTAQTFVDLDFSHHVQSTNSMWPNNSSLGPHYYNGSSFHFTNVTNVNGTSVDAIVTVSGTQGSYDLVGWIPNYNNQGGSYPGHLGAYAVYNGDTPEAGSPALGGLTYQITFYTGGDSLLPDERYQTQMALPAFRFLVYDHDGEPSQSESLTAFYSEGFRGYQIRDGSGITTYTDGDSVTFHSRGANHSETDDSGSFIAYFENTSSISFQLTASTTHEAVGPAGGWGNTHGIFTAFDGSLNLVGGNTENFGAFMPVPEPSTALLGALAAIGTLLRRKR